jgi:hypothetical protein
MQDVFKGFLFLRLVGLLALLTVVAVVLGIVSLARGSIVAGVVILVVALPIGAAIGLLVARRAGGRPR